MIIKFRFIIIIFIFLVSSKFTSQKSYNYEPKYIHLADQIVIKTALQLKKEKNLDLVGMGGSMMDSVERITMSFYSNNYIDLQKARNLIVSTAQILLKNINSDNDIRSYLSNYPFTSNNIRIFINTQIKNSLIKGITLSRDIIYYYIVDLDSEIQLKEIHNETYEEALKRIENENK